MALPAGGIGLRHADALGGDVVVAGVVTGQNRVSARQEQAGVRLAVHRDCR